jgi:hypothetical protein
MLTLKRLLLLLATASLVVASSACISNPTPHPGSGDNTGLNIASDSAAVATGGTEPAPTSATDPSASEDGDEESNSAGGSEPSMGPQDASSGGDSSEGDISTDEDGDVGPDGDNAPCDGVVSSFSQALSSYQACQADDDCVLLIDDNDCDCTRAIAVSDLDGAQALLDGALLCALDASEVLGQCISDAAPTGNLATCQQGLCQAETPSESCLNDADDVVNSQDASEPSEDAGPTDDDVTPETD